MKRATLADEGINCKKKEDLGAENEYPNHYQTVENKFSRHA